MKLTESEFFPVITDRGVEELQSYCKSILFKAGRRIPTKDFEDIEQEMMLTVLQNIHKYDKSKGIPLGGFLYLYCKGALTSWCRKHNRELPLGTNVVEYYLNYHDLSNSKKHNNNN